MESRHFELASLGGGVWAALHRHGGDATCNAGIVDLGDATLVFDAFLTPRAGRDLAAAALELTGRAAAYLVYSHYHNDHIRGATAFPDATVVATEATRGLVDTLGRKELEQDASHARTNAERLESLRVDGVASDRAFAEFYLPYWRAIEASLPEARVRLPELTFDGRLAFHGTVRTALLVQIGPAHTPDDTVLLLPDDGVAFTSDLVFVQSHPFLPDGDPDAWIDVLQGAGAWGADRVVPGHGPVGTMDDVRQQVEYMLYLQREAERVASDRIDLATSDPPEIPAPYQSWLFARPFYATNLRFLAEREASRGKPA